MEQAADFWTARLTAYAIGREANSTDVRPFVRDNGPGLANPGNLFVPFYTTKPHGRGIGLVLA